MPLRLGYFTMPLHPPGSNLAETLEEDLRQIELRDALRQHQGMVVRKTRDARTELDSPRAGQRLGDEQVGAGDVLPRRREVLADPRLGVAQLVQHLDLAQVLFESLRQVRSRRVERHREIAEA